MPRAVSVSGGRVMRLRGSVGDFMSRLARMSMGLRIGGMWGAVRRATLSDLVNEKAALSPEMAMRVEKAFGVSMDTLLRMQAWHDGYIMRQRAGEIDVKKFTPPTGPR